MYLPFELFCVIAEVFVTRLIGTVLLAAGAGVLLSWIRDEQARPVPASVEPGGLLAARSGSGSLAQLGVLFAGLCCVAGGLFLWTR
jgi:hypothetical protein